MVWLGNYEKCEACEKGWDTCSMGNTGKPDWIENKGFTELYKAGEFM